MLRAIWNAARSSLGSVLGFAGAASTVAGLAAQGGAQVMAIPPWVWWLVAIGCLAALNIRLQWKLDQSEHPAIKRLRVQPFVTFGEAATAVAASNPAYTHDEVLARLVLAVERHQFPARGGKPRLFVTAPSTGRREGLDLDKIDDIRDAASLAYQTLAINSAFGGPDAQALLTIRSRDFFRWHSRFQAGQYEQ